MAARNEFSTVKKILLLQALVVMVIASGFLMLGGWINALSPAMGGVIALLPNCFFAYKMFLSRNLEAKKIVRSFYTGESTKIILTAALFTMVFQIPNLNLLTLLIGYLAVLSVFWFALILWRN